MSKLQKIADKISITLLDEIKESNFYRYTVLNALEQCISALEPRQVKQVICYGLGRFHGGLELSSRYQLAFLIQLFRELRNRMPGIRSVIEIYDPCFEKSDRDTLELFREPRFKLIDKNEHCARILNHDKNSNDATLVFMPHLDKHLYNNLIGANWTPDSLSQLVVLGNSFNEMVSYELLSRRKTNLYYLDKLVSNLEGTSNKAKGNSQALVEIAVDDSSSFSLAGIFNSLAFHLVCSKWVARNGALIIETRIPGWIPVS